jgi:hypothetical protein
MLQITISDVFMEEFAYKYSEVVLVIWQKPMKI